MRSTIIIILLATTLLAGEELRPKDEILADLGRRNYQTRRKAVLAVEGREEPELLEEILRMAREDDHPNIRSYCADVLGTFDDDRIFPLLVKMARTEKWVGPRSSSFVAMGRLGRPDAYPILVAGLEDKSCRGYAAKGLGLLGDDRAWHPILAVWRANPRDGFLMDMAPAALVKLDENRAIKLFLDLFAMEETGRWYLVRSLREHPDPFVRKAMTAHLDSEDEKLLNAAIEVLGTCGDTSTVDALLTVFEKQPESRGVVAKSLAEIGDARAARPLAAALGKETEPVEKVTLIGALADLGDKRAIAGLMAHVDDETITSQPRTISSIWRFPYNLRVGAAALWAIRTLIDGEEPVDRFELSSFPAQPDTKWEYTERGKVKAWWKEHGEDAAYRFTE